MKKKKLNLLVKSTNNRKTPIDPKKKTHQPTNKIYKNTKTYTKQKKKAQISFVVKAWWKIIKSYERKSEGKIVLNFIQFSSKTKKNFHFVYFYLHATTNTEKLNSEKTKCVKYLNNAIKNFVLSFTRIYFLFFSMFFWFRSKR